MSPSEAKIILGQGAPPQQQLVFLEGASHQHQHPLSPPAHPLSHCRGPNSPTHRFQPITARGPSRPERDAREGAHFLRAPLVARCAASARQMQVRLAGEWHSRGRRRAQDKGVFREVPVVPASLGSPLRHRQAGPLQAPETQS